MSQLPKGKIVWSALAAILYSPATVLDFLGRIQTIGSLFTDLGICEKSSLLGTVECFKNVPWLFSFLLPVGGTLVLVIIWRKQLLPILGRDRILPTWTEILSFIPRKKLPKVEITVSQSDVFESPLDETLRRYLGYNQVREKNYPVTILSDTHVEGVVVRVMDVQYYQGALSRFLPFDLPLAHSRSNTNLVALDPGVAVRFLVCSWNQGGNLRHLVFHCRDGNKLPLLDEKDLLSFDSQVRMVDIKVRVQIAVWCQGKNIAQRWIKFNQPDGGDVQIHQAPDYEGQNMRLVP